MSNIMENLKSCSVELIEKLILSYPEAIETLERTSTLRDKRELLESCVLGDDEDPKRKESIELIVQDYAEFVEKNEDSLKTSKEAYTSAKRQYDNEKEDYKVKAQAKITEAIEMLKIKERDIAKYEQRLNKERAKKLRKNIRHKGLVFMAKGAIAATIDGIEKEYSATAQVVMTSAINDTKAAMRNYKENGEDVNTLESTEALVEAVSSDASKTSKNTQGGKHISTISVQVEAARQSLIAQLSPVPDSLQQEVGEQPEAVPQI